MNKKFLLAFFTACITIFLFGIIGVSAATSGYYTYTVLGGMATITDVDTQIYGDITVPSYLGGYPVTNIGDDAFYDCQKLTGVKIPNTVKNIGGYVFFYCENLTYIEIPESVTSIGEQTFRNCYRLVNIDVDENNPEFCSINGALFSKDETNILQYPIGKTDTEYIIPDSVKVIGPYSFYQADNLGNIVIPHSVTSIGKASFAYSDNLKNIVIPDGVTNIENEAFSACLNLTTVTLPGSVINIGKSAFNVCSALTDVYYKGTFEEWEGITIGSYNTYLTDAIRHYVKPSIKVSLFATLPVGDMYDIIPENIPAESTIIFACYSDDTLVYIEATTYGGEPTLNFTECYEGEYDVVRVFVWKNFGTMYPICESGYTDH